jgi:hypothetical protein
MVKPVKRVAKKPYIRPTLTVHGTVRELTLKVGTRGKTDGGTTLGRKHSHL